MIKCIIDQTLFIIFVENNEKWYNGYGDKLYEFRLTEDDFIRLNKNETNKHEDNNYNYNTIHFICYI